MLVGKVYVCLSWATKSMCGFEFLSLVTCQLVWCTCASLECVELVYSESILINRYTFVHLLISQTVDPIRILFAILEAQAYHISPPSLQHKPEYHHHGNEYHDLGRTSSLSTTERYRSPSS